MLFDRFKSKEYSDNEILSPVTGRYLPLSEVKDAMFREEMLGQTTAILPSPDVLTLVAPANGTLEVMYPTGHAYAVRMKNGMGILIHVGIDTCKMNGKGFKILAKKGEEVKAGQPILRADFDLIKEQGYDISVFMIFTDAQNKIDVHCENKVKSKDVLATL